MNGYHFKSKYEHEVNYIIKKYRDRKNGFQYFNITKEFLGTKEDINTDFKILIDNGIEIKAMSIEEIIKGETMTNKIDDMTNSLPDVEVLNDRIIMKRIKETIQALKKWYDYGCTTLKGNIIDCQGSYKYVIYSYKNKGLYHYTDTWVLYNWSKGKTYKELMRLIDMYEISQ